MTNELGEKMKKLTVSLLSVLLVKTLSFAGPISGTGGGEDKGPEFMAIAKTLPAAIELKGASLFPEIDLVKLRKFLGVDISQADDKERAPSFTTNTERDLSYKNEGKIFLFNRTKKTVTIDPDKFEKLKVENPKLLVPLVFHEVLGLLELEENNDYHISSRLIGNSEYLALINLQSSMDQIISSDFTNPGVIFWRQSPGNNLTFFYCNDKNEIDTCRLLGKRSYSREELVSLMKEFENKAKNRRAFHAHKRNALKNKIENDNTALEWAIDGAVIGALSGASAMGGFTPGIAIGGIGGALIGAMMGSYENTRSGPNAQKLRKNETDQIQLNEEMNSGPYAVIKHFNSGKSAKNLEKLAHELNQLLSYLDLEPTSISTKN